MSVDTKYQKVLKHIQQLCLQHERDPSSVTLVAVSKKHPLDHILPAYESGCRDFGENRVEEALGKMESAPQDLRWHFIGSLQTKKVNKIVGHFSLIHSVDSPKLAKKIAEASKNNGAITHILLQANTSGEASKHGLSPKEWIEEFSDLLQIEGIKIEGLMTMAPLLSDQETVRQCFANLRKLRDTLEIQGDGPGSLPHLSMGMSQDYPIAIAEGATILRVGTAIF